MNQKQQQNFTIPVNQNIDDLSYIVKIYKEHFTSISGADQVALKYLIKEYNVQLLAHAIVETAETHDVRNGIQAVHLKIYKWHKRGITSIDELEATRRKQLQEYDADF